MPLHSLESIWKGLDLTEKSHDYPTKEKKSAPGPSPQARIGPLTGGTGTQEQGGKASSTPRGSGATYRLSGEMPLPFPDGLELGRRHTE